MPIAILGDTKGVPDMSNMLVRDVCTHVLFNFDIWMRLDTVFFLEKKKQ
jgi:hypothetical protein